VIEDVKRWMEAPFTVFYAFVLMTFVNKRDKLDMDFSLLLTLCWLVGVSKMKAIVSAAV
jgi:hypothetical protein